MPIIGGNQEQNRKRLQTGWLITAGLIAIYAGAIQRLPRYNRSISERILRWAARLFFASPRATPSAIEAS